VCTNTRAEGGRPACAARGSEALYHALMREILGRGLATDVAVTTSGCLGPCFDGPNLVVYPEGVWYGGVDLDDLDDVVAHLAGGPVVARLRQPDPDDPD